MYVNSFIKNESDSNLSEVQSQLAALKADYEKIQTAKAQSDQKLDELKVLMWCKLAWNSDLKLESEIRHVIN